MSDVSTKPIRLFHTKANELLTCPYKYYLRNHLKLIPKRKPFSFLRGEIVHKILEEGVKLIKENPSLDKEIALALSLQKVEDLIEQISTPEHRQQVSAILLNLWPVYTKEQFLDVENSFVFEGETLVDGVLKPYIWCFKPDGIFKDDEGVWQAEIKTTVRFTVATRVQYRESLQNWLYLLGLKLTKQHIGINGVKLFIGHPIPKNEPKYKTEYPGVAIEKIFSDKINLQKAEDFVHSIVRQAYRLETNKDFFKNRTSCRNQYGECVYNILCEPYMHEGDEQWDLSIKAAFKTEEPEAHLELE